MTLVLAPPASFILGDLERQIPSERLVRTAVHQPYILNDVVAEVYRSAVKKEVTIGILSGIRADAGQAVWQQPRVLLRQ